MKLNKSTKDRIGVALMAAGGVAAVAVIALKVHFDSAAKPGPDGCIGPVIANTVIVLDHSEAISVQTRNEIVARAMAHVQNKAELNERVTVFDVNDLSKKSLVPVFSRCKPSRTGNMLYEGVRGIEKAYTSAFIEPLQTTLSQPPTNAKESPLAQALIDVSLTQYLRGERNSLLIFSDMLEHTQKFSLYSCSDAAQAVTRFRESRKGAQERPKFAHTQVSLNMIPRLDVTKATLKCRDQVWTWFFGDNDGAHAGVNLEYLPGA